MTDHPDADPRHLHGEPGRTGVLLANLGTPETCSVSDVRRFLREFLWDRRVVETPRWLWWPILHLAILPTRPRRSAKAYEKVWTEEGSPLLVISRKQHERLVQLLDADLFRVELGMRYGNPSIADGLQRLRQAGADRILVLPLYPQYSATTTASIYDAVGNELAGWRRVPALRLVDHYHDEPGYIAALAKSVRNYRSIHGDSDLLLMSFHGIPREYFDAGDPYFCECQKTGRLLAEELDLNDDQWKLSFQSQVGPKEWLQPYTEQVLAELPDSGIGNVQVICPGFSVDCLETLEEIAMANRELFVDAGGTSFGYIPCLNDSDDHMQFLADLVQTSTADWASRNRSESERQASKARALQLGAST